MSLNPAHPNSWCSSFHLTAGVCRPHLLNLLRFRLGAHDLRVASGKWERGGSLHRSDRLCERCTQGCVEDEFHLVFECDAYCSVRDKFPHLFRCRSGEASGNSVDGVQPIGRGMAGFMNQDVHQVAAFIYQCMLTRIAGDEDCSSDCSDDEECYLSLESSDGCLSVDDGLDFLSCSSDPFCVEDDVLVNEPHEPPVGS